MNDGLELAYVIYRIVVNLYCSFNRNAIMTIDKSKGQICVVCNQTIQPTYLKNL